MSSSLLLFLKTAINSHDKLRRKHINVSLFCIIFAMFLHVFCSCNLFFSKSFLLNSLIFIYENDIEKRGKSSKKREQNIYIFPALQLIRRGTHRRRVFDGPNPKKNKLFFLLSLTDVSEPHET